MPGRGPCFDATVPPGGYLWWYVDGLSDCGRYGFSIIAFIGSVFSPYYHWSGRKNPDDHVCINVALYQPGANRWTMTERGAKSLERDATRLLVGSSSMVWDEGELLVHFDEIAVPRPPAQWLPERVRGNIRFTPEGLTSESYAIDADGKHRWRPIAPGGRVQVAFDGSRPGWSGHGYLDSNWGMEPLESAFTYWDWARGTLPDGRSVIIYDSVRRDGTADCLALVFGHDGKADSFPTPQVSSLPRGFWGVKRRAHHDAGVVPKVVQTLEDGPFYMRSIVRTQLLGQPVDLMHESLSGDRFASPIVKLMLPFRMPRRA